MTSTMRQNNDGTSHGSPRPHSTSFFARFSARCRALLLSPRSPVRSSRWAAVALAAAIVQGCPVYEDYCDSRSDCAAGYRCNAYTGDCELASYGPGPACTAPTDCGPGETCGQSRECLPGSCVYHGCVRGFACSIVDGVHSCVAGSAGGGPGAMDAGETPDAALTSDAGDALGDSGAADSTSDGGSDAAP
jgi:hypothetical protein